MSKHSSTFLACESVEVLVNEHVIVETMLARERRVAYQTHKRLYTYNKQDTVQRFALVIRMHEQYTLYIIRVPVLRT